MAEEVAEAADGRQQLALKECIGACGGWWVVGGWVGLHLLGAGVVPPTANGSVSSFPFPLRTWKSSITNHRISCSHAAPTIRNCHSGQTTP